MVKNKVIKTELFEWKKLIPLQPKNFKELSEVSYNKLKSSILNNNFVMSFAVWQDKDKTYIIDGVHRWKVLDLLDKEGIDVPEKLPCTFIDCKNKKEALKLVLIYSSIYARTTDEGLYEMLNLENIKLEEIVNEIDIPYIDFEKFNQGFIEDEKINNSFNPLFEVVVSCENEQEQENVFNELLKQGYKCRILTL